MDVSVGIDVGGTFTDLVAVDGEGRIEIRKVLSTPEDGTASCCFTEAIRRCSCSARCATRPALRRAAAEPMSQLVEQPAAWRMPAEWAPQELLPAMPPMVQRAWVEGSTGKNSPCRRSSVFRVPRVRRRSGGSAVARAAMGFDEILY